MTTATFNSYKQDIVKKAETMERWGRPCFMGFYHKCLTKKDCEVCPLNFECRYYVKGGVK